MLIIKYFKGLIFVVFFLLSLDFVLAAYPVDSSGACSGNLPAVKIGDWCYDCNKDVSEGVCPNDLLADTCTPTNPDADCPDTLACSQRTTQETCGVGCNWCTASSGAKTLVGTQCKDSGSACEYKCVAGQNGAQCSDGQINKYYGALYPWTCAETTETCSDQCTFSYSRVDASCGILYANACDDGTGKADSCGNSCVIAITPYNTITVAESACNDGVDNNCNNEWDYDTLDRGVAGNIPSHGDISCGVGVTGISVSKDNPWLGEGVEVTCTATVSGINSVDVFIENEKCSYIENSWNGNNVKFTCPTNSLGSKVVKCTIDKTKSYQSGTEQTKIVNVIQGDCSTLSKNECGKFSGCEICNECSGSLYSGGGDRCVAKGSCSYIATKDKCGAQCDAIVGGCGLTNCDALDKCVNEKFRDYTGDPQQCVNGICQAGSCTTFTDTKITKEATCNDGKDNDCDGLVDCADSDCKGEIGGNGLTCCQVNDAVTGCPADGTEGFTSCVNDNTRKGAIGSFSCVQNECKPSTKDTTSSCSNGGCCFPSGGTATCLNPGKTSVIDVDSDQLTEVCDAGNWKGANCGPGGCSDDGTAPHPKYNCATDSDCAGNIGQCGEEFCSNNVCTKREKANKQQLCNNLMPGTYQCAKFFSCSAATNYNCQYAGDSTLCAGKYPKSPGRNPYDTACSGNPDFKCNVDVCVSDDVTSNPCCLCYSQCIEAANDPAVAPESISECNIAKNYQWTNAQCPFTGGN